MAPTESAITRRAAGEAERVLAELREAEAVLERRVIARAELTEA
jgi:hypothetical protein